MKNFILLLALLLPLNSFAATGSGNVSNVINLGGFSYAGTSFTSAFNIPAGGPDGWIVYKPKMPTTVDRWTPLLKNGTHSAVAASKTLTCYEISGGPFGVSGGVQMGCSNAAVTFNDADLNATTPRYEFGANGAAAGHQFPLTNVSRYPMVFQCATGTFPAIQVSQTNTNPVWLICQEK
jgi:hypothetical protein